MIDSAPPCWRDTRNDSSTAEQIVACFAQLVQRQRMRRDAAARQQRYQDFLRWGAANPDGEEADRVDPEIRHLLNQLPPNQRAMLWTITRGFIEFPEQDPLCGKYLGDEFIRAMCKRLLPTPAPNQ